MPSKPLPPGFPPGFPDKMPGTPTSDDILGKLDFFMEWPKPIKKWDKYADWAMFVFTETAHLIIAGAESILFVAATDEITVPALTIVSPMGGGVITTNPVIAQTITDGQFIYIKDVEFPIKSNATKSLTIGNLSSKDSRRADRLFMGVRDGDTMYFRTQMGSTAGGIRFKETDFVPIEWGEDGDVPPDAAETITNGDGSVRVRKFSGSATQDIRIPWEIPESIVVSEKIKFQVVGVVTESTVIGTGITLIFKLSGYSIDDAVDIDGTYGTEVAVTLVGTNSHGQYDRFATPWSAEVTVPGLARGELAMLRLKRDTADTYPDAVGSYGVKIEYTREARQ